MSSELQLERIREIRNQMLNCTDRYVSIPDYPFKEDERQQLMNFRQQLRDLPQAVMESTPKEYIIDYFPPKLAFIKELDFFY